MILALPLLARVAGGVLLAFGANSVVSWFGKVFGGKPSGGTGGGDGYGGWMMLAALGFIGWELHLSNKRGDMGGTRRGRSSW